MEYKYELCQDCTSLVLKPNYTGFIGGVKYLQTHDDIFGSQQCADFRICLAVFRRSIDGPSDNFPKFIGDFTLEDKIDLCKRSYTCSKGEEKDNELTQIIELSGHYKERIIRADDSLCKIAH